LVKDGKVDRIFEGPAPDAKSLKADSIEASGKTLLPGLIDAAVALDQLGGISTNPRDYQSPPVLRELAAYLYCGVGAVRSRVDPRGRVLHLRNQIESGEFLGAEVFINSDAGFPAQISMLSSAAAAEDLASGNLALLNLSLVEQVGPAALLESTRRALRPSGPNPGAQSLEGAMVNLRKLWQAGTPIVAGTGSGAMLQIHGPAIHRELQLMVKAGIPPAAALESATSNAARFLKAENRIGVIKPGAEATLLLVDGNPVSEISATERISVVFFRGERVARSELFSQQ
jgi:imidazolonepropionase-like amidohydrolase